MHMQGEVDEEHLVHELEQQQLVKFYQGKNGELVLWRLVGARAVATKVKIFFSAEATMV